jgi:hypothetical protein
MYSATLQALADLRIPNGLAHEMPVITNCDTHNWIRGIRQMIHIQMELGVETQKHIQVAPEHVEIALKKLSA